MGNALRFSKKLKHPGRESYYYNAFVRDVIIATIRHDKNGWWNSWHRTLIPATEAERQAVIDFMTELTAGEGIV